MISAAHTFHAQISLFLKLTVSSFLFLACNDDKITVEANELQSQDFDGDQDGYPASEDCDDDNLQVNPAAIELCDGIDNNCNGLLDEDVVQFFFLDEDGDGFGGYTSIQACEAPSGYVPVSNDCNDENIDVYPSAPEQCDNLDNNCNGQTDENLNTEWFIDIDGDGYGNPNFKLEQCLAPNGYVADNTDCNDSEASANPWGEEVCDGFDNDCNGQTDEGLAETYYLDLDLDGYGDPNQSYLGCGAPAGYILENTDCLDSNANANPGAAETCDGIDNNCDGAIDENLIVTYFEDADLDGYGNSASSIISCQPITGWVVDDTDCDDSNNAVYPLAPEICDSYDNDCDGQINNGLISVFFQDSDGDGFGDPTSQQTDCTSPVGFVSNANDCDDANPQISPLAVEFCDELDNDCNGQTDEGVESTFYLDYDMDGFGNPNETTLACSAPQFYVSDSTDCSDNAATSYPGAPETCNSVDDNCTNGIDETFLTNGQYIDIDNCGSCGNDCTLLSVDNAVTFCDDSISIPDCGFTCAPGFLDANLDSSDGCECAFLSSNDPVFDGLDANCDGSDGDHALAIHVSGSQGSSGGTGSLNDPIATISSGISLAQSQGLFYVLIESGTYFENIDLIDGINVFGGMDSSFYLRDPSNYSTVLEGAAGSPTLSAVGITSPTSVEGLSIFSPSTELDSASVIALYIEDSSDQLSFFDNVIIADDAEDGLDGSNGQDGSTGLDGNNGGGGAVYNCNSPLFGGNGGTNSCSSGAVDGGNGASILCPSNTQTQPSGSDGDGLNFGAGGTGSCDAYLGGGGCSTCYITGCWEAGGNGVIGGDGSDGDGGDGAQTSGFLSGLTWLTEDGLSGILADDGSGGGGGGAGAGGESTCNPNRNHAGGTGAGAGAGGCGGEGGIYGTGGGSSFAVFVNCTACTSLPLFMDNDIGAGDGGNGGDGGDGGLGGFPGFGGLGGLADRSNAFCAEDGGDGGDGGFGGDGGGAGGGAGGNSYAVYIQGYTPDPLWIDADNDLDGGLPGLGGRGGRGGSRSNDGGDGGNGANGDQNW